MLENPYIIIDCETGGLSSLENPITQIAMMGVESKTFKEIERYESFVKPYDNLTIKQEALEKSMVSLKEIQAGKTAEEIVDTIIKFIKLLNKSGKKRSNPILVGHNVTFDLAFLRYIFAYCDKDISDYLMSNNSEIDYVDTIKLAKLHWHRTMKSDEVKSISLTNCCKRIGVKLFDAHGAMPDVIATKQLLEYFSKLSDKKDNKDINVKEELTLEQITSRRLEFQFKHKK